MAKRIEEVHSDLQKLQNTFTEQVKGVFSTNSPDVVKALTDGTSSIESKLVTLRSNIQKLGGDLEVEVKRSKDTKGGKEHITITPIIIPPKGSEAKASDFDGLFQIEIDPSKMGKMMGASSLSLTSGNNGVATLSNYALDQLDAAIEATEEVARGLKKQDAAKAMETKAFAERLNRRIKYGVRQVKSNFTELPGNYVDYDELKHSGSSQGRKMFFEGNLKLKKYLTSMVKDMKLAREAMKKNPKLDAERAQESMERFLQVYMQTAQMFSATQARKYASAAGYDFDEKIFEEIDRRFGPMFKVKPTVSAGRDEALIQAAESIGALQDNPFASLWNRHNQQAKNVVAKDKTRTNARAHNNIRTTAALSRGYNYNDRSEEMFRYATLTPQQIEKAWRDAVRKDLARQKVAREEKKRNTTFTTSYANELVEKYAKEYKEKYITKQISKSGRYSLPSLYDSMGLISASAAEDLDSIMSESATISDKEYNLVINKLCQEWDELKDGAKSKISRDDYIKQRMSRHYLKRADKDFNVTQQNDGRWLISGHYDRKLDAAGKTLDSMTGAREVKRRISNEMMRDLLESAGVNKAQAGKVDEIRLAEELKAADIRPMLGSVMSMLIQEASGENGRISKLFKPGNALEGYIQSVDADSITFNNDAINKMTNKEILDFLMSKEVQEFFNKKGFGIRRDADGNYVPVGDVWMGNSMLNQIDVYDWLRGVKVGRKERESTMRSLGAFKSQQQGDMSGYNALVDYMTESIDPSKGPNKKKYRQAIRDKNSIDVALRKTYSEGDVDAVKKLIEESYHEGTRENNFRAISIGYGDEFTINLEDKKYNELRLEYEDGALTEEEYKKTIFAEIERKKKEIAKKYKEATGEAMSKEDRNAIETFLYSKGGFGISVGGKEATSHKYVIPNVGPSWKKDWVGQKTVDLPFFAKELNTILRSQNANLDSFEVQALTAKLIDEVKNGDIDDAINGVRTGASFSGHTVGTSPNVTPGGMDEKNDTIYMTGNRIKAMLRDMRMYERDKNGKYKQKDIEAHYADLLETLRETNRQLGLDENTDVIEGFSGKNQRNVINSIVSRLGRGASLYSMVNRFPSISGRDAIPVKIQRDNTVGDNNIRMQSGLAKAINADFDGDTVNAILKLFSGPDARKAYETFRQWIEYEARISTEVKKMRVSSKYVDSEKGSTYFTGEKLGVSDEEWRMNLAALATRVNKPFVGQFSNMSTTLRNTLSILGMDENGDLSSSLGKRNAAQGILLRSLGQVLEQDSISSKKVDERITKILAGQDWNNLSDAEKENARGQAISSILTDYDKLTQDIYAGKITDQEFMERLAELGILTRAKGSNNIVGDTLATASAIARVKQLGLSDEDYAEIGLSKEDLESGTISSNAWLKAIGTSQSIARHTKDRQIYDLDLVHKNGYFKSLLNNRDAFDPHADARGTERYLEGLNVTLAKVATDYQPDLPQASFDANGNPIPPTHHGLLETLPAYVPEQATAATVQSENNLSETIQQLTGVITGGLIPVLTSIDKSALMDESLASPAGPLEHVTSAIKRQFGTEYTSDRGFATAVDRFKENQEVVLSDGSVYRKTGNEWIQTQDARGNKTGATITDKSTLEILGMLGYDKGRWEYLRSHYEPTTKGQIPHGIAELLLKSGVSSVDELNPNDLTSIVKPNSDGRGGSVGYWINKRSQDLGALGYSPDEINKQIEDLKKIAELKVAAFRGAGYNPKTTSIVAEGNIAFADANGSEIGGFDALKYDRESGMLTVADWKTHGKEARAHEVGQVIKYISALQKTAEIVASGADIDANGNVSLKHGDYNEFLSKNKAALNRMGYPAHELGKDTYNILRDMVVKTIQDMGGKAFGDAWHTSFSDAFKDKLYGSFAGEIIAGDERGGAVTKISSDLLARVVSNPEAADLVRRLVTGTGSFSEDDEKRLMGYTTKGTAVADVYGPLNAEQARESAENAQKEKENKSELLKLLERELELKKALLRVENDPKKQSEKEFYEKEVDKTRSAIRKKEREVFGTSSQRNKDVKEVESSFKAEFNYEKGRQKAIQDDKAEAQAEKERIANSKEVDKLFAKRLAYETEIYKYQQKSNTAITDKERLAYQQRISDLQQQEVVVMGRINELGEQGVDLSARKKIFEEDLARNQRKILADQKGQQGFWDIMTRDIMRSTYALNSFNIAHKIIQKIPQDLRKIINITKQLDQVMTNVRIVTGASTDEARRYLDTYTDLAQQLGVTTQEIANGTTEWLRQGYTIQEAEKLVTASMQLSKLGMMDASTATSSLTAALKGFKLEASEASSVVDKLVSLDLDYATSAGQIATALSKVAAVARNANMDLNETAAILTVLMDVTQAEAGSVGTALQTILSRFGNVKPGVFSEMAEEGEDSAKAINDIEKVLSPLGIRLRTSTGEMREFTDVMDELAGRWSNLDEISRNAISSAFAGTRQRNFFNTLVTSWDEVKEAEEIALNADGTAEKKYAIYTESVAASIERITVAWEKFTKKLEASGIIKDFSTLVTLLVDNLDKLVSFGAKSFLGSLRKRWGTIGFKDGLVSGFKGFFGIGGSNKAVVSEISNLNKTVADFEKKWEDKDDDKKSKAQAAELSGDGYAIAGNTTGGAAFVFNHTVAGRNVALRRLSDEYNNGSMTKEEYDTKTAQVMSEDDVDVRLANTYRHEMEPTKYDKNGNIRQGKFKNLFFGNAGMWNNPYLFSRVQRIDDKDFVYDKQNGNWWSINENGKTVATPEQLAEIEKRKKSNMTANITMGLADVGTSFGIAYETQEGDSTDKAVAGGVAAFNEAGDFALNFIPYVGPLVSQIAKMFLVPWLNDIMTEGLLDIIKGQERAREQRVELAKEQLDALNGIKDATQGISQNIRKTGTEMTASEWKTWQDDIEALRAGLTPFEILDENGDFNAENSQKNIEYQAKLEKEFQNLYGESISLSNAFSTLENKTGDYERVGTAFVAAQQKLTGELEYASKEIELFEYNQRLNDEATSEDEKEVLRQQIKAIEKSKRVSNMTAAFAMSGVSNWNPVEVAGATMNEALYKIAKVYEKDFEGTAFGADGELTEEFKNTIIKLFQSDDTLNALTNGVGKMTLGNYYRGSRRTDIESTTRMSISELAKLAMLGDDTEFRNTVKGLGSDYEALRKEILQLAQGDLSFFRTSLIMTNDELEESADSLWWVTSSDVSNGVDGLTKKFKSMGDALAEVAQNGAMSTETMKAMITQYSEMFVKNGSFSTQNFTNNFMDILTSGGGSNVFTRMAVSGAMKDSIVVEGLRATLGNMSEKDRSDLGVNNEAMTRIGTVSDIESISDIWQGNLALTNLIGEIVGAIYQGTELAQQYVDIWVEYQQYQYKTEISNLESLKDALDDVNNARENEKKLIEAQQKLENAQNEKKRVYRAGIGMVYESDASAILSAQEELDKLRAEQDKENVQYQIDILEKQNDILSNIAENTKLENLRNFILGLSGGEDAPIASVAAIQNLLENNKLNADELAEAFGVKSQKALDEGTNGLVEDLQEAFNIYNKAEKAVSSSKALSSEWFTALEKRNSAIEGVQNARANLLNNSNWGTDAYKNGNDTAFATGQTLLNAGLVNRADVNNLPTSQEIVSNILSDRSYVKPIVNIYDRGGIFSSIGMDSPEKIDKYRIDESTGELVLTDFDGYGSGFYSPKGSDAAVFYWDADKQAMTEMHPGDWWENEYASSLATYASIYGGKHASGAFHVPGGISLINEKGTEGIVTPQGTITALPSGSGVVPADLTRNLYDLGEIAPNLIRHLELSNPLESKLGNMTEDNSTNIQNLTAEFVVDKGFDFDQFLVKVRQVVDTSKHNR